jgi:hypothetical protein
MNYDTNIAELERLKDMICLTAEYGTLRKRIKTKVFNVFSDEFKHLLNKHIEDFNKTYKTKFPVERLSNAGIKFMELWGIIKPDNTLNNRFVFIGENPGTSLMVTSILFKTTNIMGSSPRHIKGDNTFLPDMYYIRNLAKFKMWDNSVSGDVTDSVFKKQISESPEYDCDYFCSDIGIGGEKDKEKQQTELVCHLIDIIKSRSGIGTKAVIIKMYKCATTTTISAISRLVMNFEYFTFEKPESSLVYNDEVYLICYNRIPAGRTKINVEFEKIQKEWLTHYNKTLRAYRKFYAVKHTQDTLISGSRMRTNLKYSTRLLRQR